MFWLVLLLCVFVCAICSPPLARSRQEIEQFEEFLVNSRIDDGVRFQARMLANPLASAWENSGKYQGDILLDDEQVQSLVQQYAEGRNAYIWTNVNWPNNTIIYEIAPHFNAVQKAAIFAGIKAVEFNTCIKFRLRKPGEKNYVKITGAPDGCYAHVGYNATRGIHIFNLTPNTPGEGCFRHNTIVHEWLHTIGFLHMQSTYNRDDYVRILWQNMLASMAYNYYKYSAEYVDNLGLPYEYDSVMHYGPYGYSINGKPTLLPIYEDYGLMGQRVYVTRNDWLRVDRLYNCPGAWDEHTEVRGQENIPINEYLRNA